MDKSVTAVVIQGLAEHKDTLGAPLCPCRHYDDKEAEAAQGFWNCPCVPMRERKVIRGAALCERVVCTRTPPAGCAHGRQRAPPSRGTGITSVLGSCSPLQECHCMLFLTEDNAFVGTDQTITMDELKAGIQGM